MICVKVTFEMEETDGKKQTILLVSNDAAIAQKFYDAVSKVIVVVGADEGVGSPRYCAFHEEKV